MWHLFPQTFSMATSSATLIALAILLLAAPPVLVFSTSPSGFRVTLHHVDSGGNFSTFQRLQRAVTRGSHRLLKLQAADKIKAPVHAGSGEYLMQLSIGTPPKRYSAIMDTGSDLIWTQCKPCNHCFKQSEAIFDPTTSSSFSKMPCSSSLCAALRPQSSCHHGCHYFYSYDDSSSTQGVMGMETFTFEMNSVEKIGFGCGSDNQGDGFGQGQGLVGLGRGPLSLVSQLREPKFSYCLTSDSDSNAPRSSTLLLGSLARIGNSDSVKTTPMLKNSFQPSFYYLALHGITVGDTRLPIDESTFAIQEDGSGGVVIDSGTTISYLEQSAFDMVKTEFISRTELPVNHDAAEAAGLDLCFSLDGTTEMPKLVFHFEGADLDLPQENYFLEDSEMGVLCLAMGGSTGLSLFGNVQQRNILLLHDLYQETLSFLPTRCDRI